MSKTKPLFRQTFEDPLFSISFNPSANNYVIGLSTGQVAAYCYDIDGSTAQFTEAWSTKRHKESCRALTYDQPGEYVFSAGSDLVLKKAAAETGRVVAKEKSAFEAAPTVMIVNENSVIVGDDDSSLSMFDQRILKRVYYQEKIHDDCITSVVGLPHKSKYQFLTSGSTTVALVDVRKGVVVQSDDQEDEILSGCLASEQSSVFAMSQGVVTVWRNDQLQDQRNRIRLSEESIDCLIAAEFDHRVYAGGADGHVRLVNSRSSKVEAVWVHSKKEEVIMLELDHEYRLVSAGMESLCLWEGESDKESDKEKESESEDDSQYRDEEIAKNHKNPSDQRNDCSDHRDHCDKEERTKNRKRKKSKKTQKNPPTKKHVHGISSFEGL